jgi:hypothetical protein
VVAGHLKVNGWALASNILASSVKSTRRVNSEVPMLTGVASAALRQGFCVSVELTFRWPVATVLHVRWFGASRCTAI